MDHRDSSVPVLSQKRLFQLLNKYFNTHLQNNLGLFLNYLEYPGVSKDKKSWFWESCTRPKTSKSYNAGFSISPITKSKSY